jgi:hypothetical protein
VPIGALLGFEDWSREEEHLHVRGATGEYAGVINGCYTLAEEPYKGCHVWQKDGTCDRWLLRFNGDGPWYLTSTERRKAALAGGWLESIREDQRDAALAGPWRVWAGGKMELQYSVAVDRFRGEPSRPLLAPRPSVRAFSPQPRPPSTPPPPALALRACRNCYSTPRTSCRAVTPSSIAASVGAWTEGLELRDGDVKAEDVTPQALRASGGRRAAPPAPPWNDGTAGDASRYSLRRSTAPSIPEAPAASHDPSRRAADDGFRNEKNVALPPPPHSDAIQASASSRCPVAPSSCAPRLLPLAPDAPFTDGFSKYAQVSDNSLWCDKASVAQPRNIDTKGDTSDFPAHWISCRARLPPLVQATVPLATVSVPVQPSRLRAPRESSLSDRIACEPPGNRGAVAPAVVDAVGALHKDSEEDALTPLPLDTDCGEKQLAMAQCASNAAESRLIPCAPQPSSDSQCDEEGLQPCRGESGSLRRCAAADAASAPPQPWLEVAPETGSTTSSDGTLTISNSSPRALGLNSGLRCIGDCGLRQEPAPPETGSTPELARPRSVAASSPAPLANENAKGATDSSR